MKSHSLLTSLAVIGVCLGSVPVQAASWFYCGTTSQFTPANGGTLPSYSPFTYEYGIAYNSVEPIPVIATSWNVGVRIANKTPYFVWSDNPATSMNQGGFVF